MENDVCQQLDGTEHQVQFYDDDVLLIKEVAEFIGAGLQAGQAGIVTLTPSHRSQLEKRLTIRGLDLTTASQRGQYIALDAMETLSAFMVDGRPDERRFVEVVGGVFARLGSRYSRVRAFGEMVALLWADHEPEATIQLERLWNNLGKSHPFNLLCAYPLGGFLKEAAGNHFRAICSEHSRVTPVNPLIEY